MAELNSKFAMHYSEGELRDLGNFKKLAVNYLILKPGERSSLPHAESLEEEAAIVVSGNPDLWWNGWICPLNPLDAVGFPAGTGDGHSILNNSQSEVHLLVLGERTKPENRCVYLVDPEDNAKSSIRWPDPPTPSLGPHSGRPGPVSPSELWSSQFGSLSPSSVVRSEELFNKHHGAERGELGRPYYYPLDTECFGRGVRLSDSLGLKKLAIWLEKLPSGRRSSWPHAHWLEEEFAFIQQGKGVAWINGQRIALAPGMGVAFQPGTNLAHCLINESENELIYFGIGELDDGGANEKIYYPLHPTRNEQCRLAGYFWEDRPSAPLEKESATPSNWSPCKNHQELELISEQDVLRCQAIFSQAPDYFLKLEGKESDFEIAKHAIMDGPKTKSESYFKQFLVLRLDGQDVGVADLHIHHRNEKDVYLGLLLIVESLQGKSWGRRFYKQLEDYCLKVFGMKKMIIGIADSNPVNEFWIKLGFVKTDRSYTWHGVSAETRVWEYEKSFE